MERLHTKVALTSSETAELLSVHTSTVKRWCNDGELASEKTAGGHRRLHLRDVMDFARKRDIETFLTPFQPYEPHVWTAFQDLRRDGSFQRLHALAMGWVMRGQRRRLGLLYDALARDPSVGCTRFCDEGVRGLMSMVGDAWSEGRLRVGDEHLTSQAMLEVLVSVGPDPRQAIDAGRAGDRASVAVVGSVEGNRHHLGAICERLVLQELGWAVHYLGPDVPLEEFAEIQRDFHADMVCISLTPPPAAGELARAVRVLSGLYDRGRPYALHLGGRIEGTVEPDLLAGPFTDIAVHDSCASLCEHIGHDVPSRPSGSAA